MVSVRRRAPRSICDAEFFTLDIVSARSRPSPGRDLIERSRIARSGHFSRLASGLHAASLVGEKRASAITARTLFRHSLRFTGRTQFPAWSLLPVVQRRRPESQHFGGGRISVSVAVDSGGRRQLGRFHPRAPSDVGDRSLDPPASRTPSWLSVRGGITTPGAPPISSGASRTALEYFPESLGSQRRRRVAAIP